jgi:hypothetical protein
MGEHESIEKEGKILGEDGERSVVGAPFLKSII